MQEEPLARSGGIFDNHYFCGRLAWAAIGMGDGHERGDPRKRGSNRNEQIVRELTPHQVA